MAYIKIMLDRALMDGHMVTFKAPCDCTEIEGLKVCYVQNNSLQEKTFTMKDTHKNSVVGLGNLFKSGAYVLAILDSINYVAYLQNADTNGYLESKFAGTVKLLSDLGVSASADELNHMKGVTSGVQGQLDKKASLDGNEALTNKTYNGYTLGDACARSVADVTEPTFFPNNNVKLATLRRIYYGMPTFNGTRQYNSNTNLYCPNSVGTNGYVLVSNGNGAPSWKSFNDSVGTLSEGSITTTTIGTDAGNIRTVLQNSLRKWGRVIQISFLFNTANNFNNGVYVGTLPAGFKPNVTVYIPNAKINTDGTIYYMGNNINVSGGADIHICGTYLNI